MAKLFDNEAEKSISVKAFITIIGVIAVLAGSFINYKVQTTPVEDATEALIGVHIKGAVVSEGYYEVPFGIRVKELEGYVGGFLPEADLNEINLAGFVKDGEEIYVPYKASKDKGAVNLNTVTKEELMEIDGIGENYANKIITYRNERGKIEKVIELRTVLGVSTYNSVREKFYVE